MESCYSLALGELEEIRKENKNKSEMRHKEVISKIPEISGIEAELMKNGTALLQCVLDKRKDFESIKENIKALQKKKLALLKAGGFSEDYLDEIYTCEKCHDTGFVDGKRCSCHKMLILKYMSKNSNLTDFMLKQKFENFDFELFRDEENPTVLKVMKKLCEKAMNFAEEFDETGDSILLLGNAGTGKTFISSCIANRALERGKSVYYQTAYRLFEMFEDAKFKGNTDNAEALEYVFDVDLLIIDDLGTEFISQFTAATFFNIINTRLNEGKSTVISTNLSFEGLEDIYSARTTSRLLGEYTVLQTAGEDLRKKMRIKAIQNKQK